MSTTQHFAKEKRPELTFRMIVVGIIHNENDEYLICRMPEDRGVFPGQWGLPGGGIEEGERMEAALRRELREELGIEVSEIRPLFFKDGQHTKSFADGSRREVYMIFLIFTCRANSIELKLSPEFSDYAWVKRDELLSYELNNVTIETFKQAGFVD